MTTETLHFSADVSRLLDIVANALYTNHDVFLRELISNAADACDRLRYEAIANPVLIKDNPEFRIHVFRNGRARTLSIVDNGIGMNREELIENLGTIAKSGSAALMETMKDKKGGDALKLIGQFGVGFYASYMVASMVSVISRRAGSEDIWTWESEGRSGFNVHKATEDEAKELDGTRGTAVILKIKDEGSEFLIDEKIKQTVQQYSDHIDVPIYLMEPGRKKDEKDKPVNVASALWMRSKNDITPLQYDEFYRHITHGLDEPQMISHWRAEGKIEYTALLFIPTLRPWDLYDPTRKHAVKLYVRRVFITDKLEGLIYPWLRFLRGVIDSEDLPLNISRENLQFNPIVSKIRSGVAKRVLSDLDKLSREDAPAFITFWAQFGAALKEGLYDAPEHRDDIFKVCRFYSTQEDGEKFTSLDDYIARMKEGQDEIYYISGENLDSLKSAPQIEGFRAQGYEVLFFTDTIDDFWLQGAPEYKGKKFKSVTKGDITLGAPEKQEKPDAAAEKLVIRLREILHEEVSGVRVSHRLTDSAVCLVAADSGTDMNMERVLKIHQKYQGGTKPVLEINTGHPLIQRLQALCEPPSMTFADAAKLILDQARIIQGEPLKDASGFARRMSAFLEKAL